METKVVSKVTYHVEEVFVRKDKPPVTCKVSIRSITTLPDAIDESSYWRAKYPTTSFRIIKTTTIEEVLDV
jgi:hypothetical protein